MTDKTREDFEAWVTKQGHAAGYGGDGVYDVWVVSRWWESWQAATQQSAARIAELEAEVQALRKDAERLDWIAMHGSFGVDSVTGLPGGNGQTRKAATRRGIDAAIEAERGEG